MRPSSLFPAAVALSAAAFLGCHPASVTPQATPPAPDNFVAEGVIQTAQGSYLKYVFLPVTVAGQPASALLDLGSTGNIFTRALDSISIGTLVERNTASGGGFFPAEAPVGMAPSIGLIGTPILSHYNFLIDGPARRVRLYTAPTIAATGQAPKQVGWLPPGLAPEDCLPLDPDPVGGRRVFFPLLVNGQAIHSMFDSGSDFTNINLAAAKVLGITKRTPGIRLLPRDSAPQFSMYNGQKVWEVPGITLTIGKRHFTETRLHIYQHLPRETSPEDPELSLGLGSVLSNLLYISYSNGQFCLGDRQPSTSGTP